MSQPLPHIAVVGAGNIGCYIGGRLHGHARVSLIGRPRMASAVAEHGLQLSDLQGYERRLGADEVEFHTDLRAADGAQLILVTVKSDATVEVARELAQTLSRPSLLLSLQNGLRNADSLRQCLPTHTVLAGMVPFNVLQRAPAAFHQGSSGHLMAQADPRLAAFLPAFREAGLALSEQADMAAVQQAKLLLNLNNAINALSDLPLREELSQRAWRRCLAMAQREALRVFAAAGMHPARLTPLPPRWLPGVLELPDRWFALLASRMLAIDPLARSSTWEDLQAGRRTELDAIQGEVVALAAAHGLTAPVNAQLLALVRAVEQQRRRYGGDELLHLLQQAARNVPGNSRS